MSAKYVLLGLPAELLLEVLRSCSCLRDVHAFASTCKHVYGLFSRDKISIYDHILRQSIVAYEDVLRLQRATLAGLQHLKGIGYGENKHVDALLPPRGTPPSPSLPVCRFDTARQEYIDAPSKYDIVKLGELPLASLWELHKLLDFVQIVTIFRRNLPHHQSWFCLHVKEWTQAQEHRFFRGAYRYWLYCALFYPGCYLEAAFVEKEHIGEVSDITLQIPQYPIFSPSLRHKARLHDIGTIFVGFTDFLIADGERIGSLEETRRPRDGSGLYHDGSPATHGAMRELLLMHTMHACLFDAMDDPKRQIDLGIDLLGP